MLKSPYPEGPVSSGHKIKIGMRILLFWKVTTECQGGKWGCIRDEELSPRTGKEEKSGTKSFG